MSYRLRTLPFLKLNVARGVVAAILILVLLSGVTPFSTVSATAVCTMECCVGLPMHEAGSCDMNMSAGTQGPGAEEFRGMTGATNEVTGGVMGMEDSHSSFDAVTIDASAHCHTKSTAAASHDRSTINPSAQTSVAAQSLAKPCPPECGICAMSFAQLRRSRETAALAHALHPRPPTTAPQVRSLEANLLTATALQERIRPRGPPIPFS